MICKYGRQHAFEKKARCPFPRRIIKKPPDDQSLAVSDRGKEDISGWRPSLVPFPSNSPEIIKREVSTKSVFSQTPPFTEVLAKRMKPTGLLAKSFDSRCSMLREVLAKKNSSVLLSLTKSFVGKTPVSRGVLVNKKTMTQEGSTKSADSQDSGSSETRTRKKTSAAWSSEVKSSTKSVGIQGSGLSGIQTKTKTSAVGRKKNSGVKSPPSITMQDLASSSEKPKVSLKQVLSKSKELNSSAKQASSLNPKLSSPDASRVLGDSDINIKQRKGPPK